MQTEIVHNGHDNTIDLLLKADGVIISLSFVTKVDLVVDDTKTITDSTPNTGPIIWDEAVTNQTGKMILALGDESIPPGNYDAKLILYDSSNPDGIVWSGPVGLPLFVV